MGEFWTATDRIADWIVKTPLVSVMMPAFNAGSTVERALSSLVAQTFQGWEVILVDDGSTDDTWERALRVEDRRIRRIRWRQNRGRGAARRFALRQSEGSFVCMLDADDWYYPWKLECQLESLESEPDAVLISSAMASVSDSGELVGVWRNPALSGEDVLAPQLRSLLELSFPHAPCMIRSGNAKAFGYHAGLRRAEEYHHLALVLKDHRYLVSGRVLYAYTEAGSYAKEGSGPRYLWSALASALLIGDFPVSASLLTGRKLLQGLLAVILGGRRVGVRRKPPPPSSPEVAEHDRARGLVEGAVVQAVGLGDHDY